MKKYQYEELDFTETAQQCRQEQGSPKSEEHHVSKENKTPTDSQHWSWSNRTSAISQHSTESQHSANSQHSTESQHSAISQHSWQGNAWQGDSWQGNAGQGHSWSTGTQRGVQRGGTQSSRPTQPQLTTEPVPRPTSANQSERHSTTSSTDATGTTSGTDGTTSGTDATGTTSATVEEHNYQYQESQNQWYFVSESWKELLNQKKTWIWRKDGQQQKGKKIWYEIEYEGDTPSKQKRNDGDQTERDLRKVKVQVLHSQGGDCEGLRRAIQSGQASVVGNSELVWQYEGNTCWQVFDRESSREMMQQAMDKHQHSWTHTYSKCEGNWEGVGNLTDSFGANPPSSAQRKFDRAHPPQVIRI